MLCLTVGGEQVLCLTVGGGVRSERQRDSQCEGDKLLDQGEAAASGRNKLLQQKLLKLQQKLHESYTRKDICNMQPT